MRISKVNSAAVPWSEVVGFADVFIGGCVVDLEALVLETAADEAHALFVCSSVSTTSVHTGCVGCWS